MVGTGGGADRRTSHDFVSERGPSDPAHPCRPWPSCAEVGGALRLSWWRFRATFGRRWPGYLAVALLVGLLGGLSMGAVAGARRTQSSFPVYLASTNPSDVQFFTEFAPSTNIGYSARRRPCHRPGALRTALGGRRRLRRHLAGAPAAPQGRGPRGGATVVRGEPQRGVRRGGPGHAAAGPAGRSHERADEFVVSASGAKEYGLHIGSTLPLGFYTDQQASSPTFAGYPTDKPHLSIDMKLVGIIEASQQVVQDDDAALGDQLAVITPALTRRLATCCAYYSYVALQIDDAARHEAAVSAAVDKIVPGTVLGSSGGGQTDTAAVAEAERVIRPEAVAFGVFGLVAALAALLICGQVLARLVRRNAEDGAVLRALGAGPLMTTSDGLIGIFGRPGRPGWCWPWRWPSGCRRWRPSAPYGPSIRIPVWPSTGRCSGPAPRSSSSCWGPPRS